MQMPLVDKLKNWTETGITWRENSIRKMVITKQALDGKLWEFYRDIVKSGQKVPDINLTRNIANMKMAELLLEQFAPEFKALRPEDEKLVEKLNATMEYYLSGSNIHVKITDAIRNACEFGTGIITVGVNGTQVHGPRGAEETGMVAAKVWSPFKWIPDPTCYESEDIQKARFHSFVDSTSVGDLMNNEEFAQRIIESGTFNVAAANSLSIRMSPNGRAQYTGSADDESSRVVDVITTYYRDVYVDAMGQERTCISMTIWTNGVELKTVQNITTKYFPIRVFCEHKVAHSVWGRSTAMDTLSTHAMVNDLLSIAMTHAEKKKDPILFVNGNSGINIQRLKTRAHEAGQVFVTDGDPKGAIQVMDTGDLSPSFYGMLPMVTSLMQVSTGVSGASNGSDTGSILTTGGMQTQQEMASMPSLHSKMNLKNFLIELAILVKDIVVAMQQVIVLQSGDEMATQELQALGNLHCEVELDKMLAKSKLQTYNELKELMQIELQYGMSNPGYKPSVTMVDVIALAPMSSAIKKKLLDKAETNEVLQGVEEVTAILTLVQNFAQQGVPEEQIPEMVAQQLAQIRSGAQAKG